MIIRILFFLAVATASFGLTPIWEYEPCGDSRPTWDYNPCEDSLPVSTVPIATIPAGGSFNVDRSAPIYILTPRMCRNATSPTGWYGEDFGALFYWQGVRFWMMDSILGSSWQFEFAQGNSNDCRRDFDTVAVCASSLFEREWVTRPVDTFFVEGIEDTSIYTSVKFLTACQREYCDSCAFIVHCDTLNTCYDTLKITRPSEYKPFYQVEWFIRQIAGDSIYYDTLMYVTAGDTSIYVVKHPDLFRGTSDVGTTDVYGWRSAGMDIYCTYGKVVSSVDSLEINRGKMPFSFSWSGFSHGERDSLKVWGLSSDGRSSDTTTIYRTYRNSNRGSMRPR